MRREVDKENGCDVIVTVSRLGAIVDMDVAFAPQVPSKRFMDGVRTALPFFKANMQHLAKEGLLVRDVTWTSGTPMAIEIVALARDAQDFALKALFEGAA